MTLRRFRTAIAAAVLAGVPGFAAAQFPPPPGSAPGAVRDRWPDPPRSPAAEPAPAPERPATPAPRRQAQPRPSAPGPDGLRTTPDGDVEPLPPRPSEARPSTWDGRPADEKPAGAKPAAPRAQPTVLACNGVFGKDSTHLKLAIKYDSRNVVFGDVDGPEGSKIKASVLYPTDPRRRLEVLWNNDASRSDTQVIAINGKSQWVAPKGLKLGLGIAALEKINGRPFKLSGIAADGSVSILSWEGGALSSLPGGCKAGLRLMPDSKSSPDARNALAGDKEFLSSDESVRAVKPAVAEVLIGY